jgi:hypothetical protein
MSAHSNILEVAGIRQRPSSSNSVASRIDTRASMAVNARLRIYFLGFSVLQKHTDKEFTMN